MKKGIVFCCLWVSLLGCELNIRWHERAHILNPSVERLVLEQDGEPVLEIDNFKSYYSWFFQPTSEGDIQLVLLGPGRQNLVLPLGEMPDLSKEKNSRRVSAEQSGLNYDIEVTYFKSDQWRSNTVPGGTNCTFHYNGMTCRPTPTVMYPPSYLYTKYRGIILFFEPGSEEPVARLEDVMNRAVLNKYRAHDTSIGW